MSGETKMLIAIIALTLVLFAFWYTMAAMFDWSTARTVTLTQPPSGFELECVDNPDQHMVCKAYCGPDYPRPGRPHP